MVKEFVVANLGRVFQGVEYPSRREACQARHREYVRARRIDAPPGPDRPEHAPTPVQARRAGPCGP